MKKLNLIALVVILVLVTACKKDWMAEKRDISLIIPSSLQDMRRLLNDANTFRNDYRMLASMAVDEYYINDQKYNAISSTYLKESYIWTEFDYNARITEVFWGSSYKQIFYTNIILEGCEKIAPRTDEQQEYNDIKGAALFFRARAFYSLAVQFAEPYINKENGEALGIPLRLNSDISAPVVRNSLKETYSQITNDLKEAVSLLRREIPNVKIIASKSAAMGLLARCYLGMADYESAFAYADSSLMIYDELIDFNTLDLEARFPFSLYNTEVIHDSPLAPIIRENTAPEGIVDNRLYVQYEENDLRKHYFFVKVTEDEYSFRGSYHGDWGNFGGVSVNELLLIRSECAVRLGQSQKALDDLNLLLIKRYKIEEFSPLVIKEKEELLTTILMERRKELLFRGLRWEDLRRLNREYGREETLSRTVKGEIYTLDPNSPRYVFKIPEQVILETGIQQND